MYAPTTVVRIDAVIQVHVRQRDYKLALTWIRIHCNGGCLTACLQS